MIHIPVTITVQPQLYDFFTPGLIQYEGHLAFAKKVRPQVVEILNACSKDTGMDFQFVEGQEDPDEDDLVCQIGVKLPDGKVLFGESGFGYAYHALENACMAEGHVGHGIWNLGIDW